MKNSGNIITLSTRQCTECLLWRIWVQKDSKCYIIMQGPLQHVSLELFHNNFLLVTRLGDPDFEVNLCEIEFDENGVLCVLPDFTRGKLPYRYTWLQILSFLRSVVTIFVFLTEQKQDYPGIYGCLKLTMHLLQWAEWISRRKLKCWSRCFRFSYMVCDSHICIT